MFALFGLFEYFDQGCVSPFFSCALSCECNRPFFLATAFNNAMTFNGDLNQWDVSNVTDMSASKSVCILEDDLT